MSQTSRREMFRRLAGRAAAVADDRLSRAASPAPPPDMGPPAARRLLEAEELDGLVDAHELTARRALVHELARVSWRLVEPDERHQPGRPGWSWSTAGAADAGMLGVGTLDVDPIDEPVCLLVSATSTPAFDGALLVCDEVRVVPTDGVPRGSRTTALVPELSLPRAWSAAVQDAGLGRDESDAWTALRQAVADAQGVTLFDREPAPLATHRAFGYPDERTGLMPELCAADGDARAWRLLLQLTLSATPDPARWPVDRDRLYLWIAEPALAAGDLSGVRGFFQ